MPSDNNIKYTYLYNGSSRGVLNCCFHNTKKCRYFGRSESDRRRERIKWSPILVFEGTKMSYFGTFDIRTREVKI